MIRTPGILKEKAEQLGEYYRKYYPALAPLAGQCFLNTIETTVRQLEDGSYFVITGDIPAMWLRDSSAQVRHYIRFADKDAYLQSILESIIEKQAEFVCLDPYANAFNEARNGAGFKDDTELNDQVWERKYEVDSLCAPLYLAHAYWKETGKAGIFNEQLHGMIRNVVRVFQTEQDHSNSAYRFQRYNCVESDTLPCNGRGRDVKITGMTWSGFRPSDDSCFYNYLIPANMMACKALEYAAEICETCYGDRELAGVCRKLAGEIRDGIEGYAIVEHGKYGKIYAYETDGYGNYLLMDDANSPSLLAMPYLGYCGKEDSLYQNTRRFILSPDNPYYKEGRFASGVGSPHTPEGYIWHIGIIMQAMTSTDREEILRCLQMLGATHGGTNYMHEAFDPDNPTQYTRSWFAWANSLFSELLLNLMERRFFEAG